MLGLRPPLPRSCLPPAGCTGTRGGERVFRACVVRVPCATICVCCVCVCCLRVSVDTSNSTAQTSRPTADPRPSSSPKVDLNQVQPLASCLSHALCSGAHLRAWFVPLLLGWGSVWPKQQTSRRLLELGQATQQRNRSPASVKSARGDTVAHAPRLLVPWLSRLRGFSPL